MAEKTTDKPRAVRSHDAALDKEYIQWIQDIKQRFRICFSLSICLLMLVVKNCNKLLQKFMKSRLRNIGTVYLYNSDTLHSIFLTVDGTSTLRVEV